MAGLRFQIGACYSNGDFGRHWVVRQVLALTEEAVEYKVVVGEQRRKRFRCSREEFEAWARYRVERDENSWCRAE